MPTEQKIEAVDRLREKLEGSTIVISADPTGMSVTDMTAFRRALRERGVEFRVIKNSLAYLAADAAEKPLVKEIIQGPTGIALGTGDPIEPAKALVDFIKANRSPMTIRGAVLEDRALTGAEVESLAALPGKDQLLAQLAGLLMNTVTSLVYVLNAPLAGLATVLQRHAESLKSGEAAVEDDAAEAEPDSGAEAAVRDTSADDAEASSPDASEGADGEDASEAAADESEETAEEPVADPVAEAEVEADEDGEGSGDAEASGPDASESTDGEDGGEASADESEETAEEPVADPVAEAEVEAGEGGEGSGEAESEDTEESTEAADDSAEEPASNVEEEVPASEATEETDAEEMNGEKKADG